MSEHPMDVVYVPFDPQQPDDRVILDAKNYSSDQRVSVQVLVGAFYSALQGAGNTFASPSFVSITSRRVFKDAHKHLAHMNANDPYRHLIFTPQQALDMAQALVKFAGEAITLDSQRKKESAP